jgi:hypothetical protein
MDGSRAELPSSPGGDSGIGRAVAIAYTREGADVVIAYLNEERRDRGPPYRPAPLMPRGSGVQPSLTPPLAAREWSAPGSLCPLAGWSW